MGSALLLGVGCGNSSGGSGGGGGTSSEASLAISISGVPNGTQAAVTVTSDSGFNQQVTSSQTIDVAAGTYTVTAKPIAQTAAIYEPDQVTKSVTASNSSSITVKIHYAALTYAYSAIDYPGAQSTIATGVNNAGVVSALYIDSGGNYNGFTFSKNSFSSFRCPDKPSSPGSVGEKWVYGINDNGQMVGYCLYAYSPYTFQTPGFAENGFLYDGGGFNEIDYPSGFDNCYGI